MTTTKSATTLQKWRSRSCKRIPKRQVQHPSYGHNPFEHTDTVVSLYRTRTYCDGQISVEQTQDGAHQKVL